ncbi:MAG: GGDEF domain-containing response regulator [Chloroflexi bacterium]|nr:MAG: GGDEF domain-containing response regulator [Chloroflexota bacterium]
MEKPAVRVLLVEDNVGDARLIELALAAARWTRFELERVDTLAAALARASQGGIDVMLLDLTLPDSSGIQTLREVYAQAREIPIVVFTGLDDDELAFNAVNEGAQDFLVKGRADTELLDRSIRYAIERHRALEQVRQLSIVDELTGLNNRRGFLVLFEHHRELAARKQVPLTLIFIDLDGMKRINDSYGHQEGDRALIETGRLLTATFRKSDVIARLGGDEFCVLLTEGSEQGGEVAINRLVANAESAVASAGRPYRLSLSLGIGRYDPKDPVPVDILIQRADHAMYVQKEAKKRKAS